MTLFFFTKLKQRFFSEPCLGLGGFPEPSQPQREGVLQGHQEQRVGAHESIQPVRAGRALSLCPHTGWG